MVICLHKISASFILALTVAVTVISKWKKNILRLDNLAAAGKDHPQTNKLKYLAQVKGKLKP